MEPRQIQNGLEPSEPTRFRDHAWIDSLIAGIAIYYLTSLIVLLAMALGVDYLKTPSHAFAKNGDILNAFANWDGEWYARIINEGYRYDPRRPSSIAFFPGFPIVGGVLSHLNGLTAESALLIVAHLALLATFALFAAYLRRRLGENSSGAAAWALLAFGLWPTTMFCRMAYSESLFLLAIVSALYGLERRWPSVAIALVIGFATATRSVGVCLLIPFACHLWQNRSASTSLSLKFVIRWIGRGALLALACWGLLAFMLFQYVEFGDALAFARTQENWRFRPAVAASTKVVDLLTLEPVRAVFDSESPWCWHRPAGESNPLFSLHLANPLYWLAALVLIGVGIWKRWLTPYEWSLALGMLLVPYVLRGHEMCMMGMGRFTAVVFPIYIVLGHVLARLPAPVAAGLLAISGFFLGAYAALFAAWYRIF